MMSRIPELLMFLKMINHLLTFLIKPLHYRFTNVVGYPSTSVHLRLLNITIKKTRRYVDFIIFGEEILLIVFTFFLVLEEILNLSLIFFILSNLLGFETDIFFSISFLNDFHGFEKNILSLGCCLIWHNRIQFYCLK